MIYHFFIFLFFSFPKKKILGTGTIDKVTGKDIGGRVKKKFQEFTPVVITSIPQTRP